MSPTPPEPAPKDSSRLGARQLAQAKREAMARRAKRIRVWVAATTASLFLAAFLVVYVQLASGHDPGLVASAQRRAAASSGSSSSNAESGTGTGSGESSSTGESSSSSESSGESSSSASEAESESESSGSSELRTSQS